MHIHGILAVSVYARAMKISLTLSHLTHIHTYERTIIHQIEEAKQKQNAVMRQKANRYDY